MKYYRVLKSVHDRCVSQRGNPFYLVGNELLTKNEVVKKNIPFPFLECIEISKKKTHFFFGARSEDNKPF